MKDVVVFAPLQIKVSAVCREVDDDDEEEARSPLTCEECGRTDRGHQLLVCTQCDSGYYIVAAPYFLFLHCWFFLHSFMEQTVVVLQLVRTIEFSFCFFCQVPHGLLGIVITHRP